MIDSLTDTLAKATTRYVNARAATRAALARRLHELCAQAIAERHEFDSWLADREGWFVRNPHSQRFDERETHWLAVLDAYAALNEAIGAAQSALGLVTPTSTAWEVRPGTLVWEAWAASLEGSGSCRSV